MPGGAEVITAEARRLDEARTGTPWRRWGPYLSERQWGTVREDYSPNGTAWDYFTHDQARSRAYRWGEDGILGISDDTQRLCFALALWNGRDPIIKERMFGLTNSEGNHGEDVKEYWFYLDSTPTHSWMRGLYKYPQAAYPYDDLVATNRARGRDQPEYELLDTGVFDDDRYWDVEVEYAKVDPERMLVAVTAHNRGPDAATLHLLPTLWFRNTWSWSEGAAKPSLWATDVAGPPTSDGGPRAAWAVDAEHEQLGRRRLQGAEPATLLFTENETNTERIFGTPNASAYVKDGINDALIGDKATVNPERRGTKVAAHHLLEVPAGQSARLHLWFGPADGAGSDAPSPGDIEAFEAVRAARRAEADAFYQGVIPPNASADEAAVIRQALGGMFWGKQYYSYDVMRWQEGDAVYAKLAEERRSQRNQGWSHMVSEDIISMPDKWEYPWFAAWDLAFHTVVLAIADIDFAKDQLLLMTRSRYVHPNGQIPAYEWAFDDVNPPVHGLAAWRVYILEQEQRGDGDRSWLRRIFGMLVLNFTWWVNRKDRDGRNVFEGGFLGLDNIGIFDRSAPLPGGGYLEQSDGTAWMAMYCLNLGQIAMELAKDDPDFEDMAAKFYEHFVYIASAMDRMGDNEDELWDEDDGFYYDIIHRPDGSAQRIKLRSMVGLLPLGATLIAPEQRSQLRSDLVDRVAWLRTVRPELMYNLTDLDRPGPTGRRMLSVMTETKLRRILSRMLDDGEFLSPYGIRALSAAHRDHPFTMTVADTEYTVAYEPAESSTGLFGGNSNWRGPIWFPVNLILIEALLKLHLYYGDDFRVALPTGSDRLLNLGEVAQELSRRLGSIFTRDASGRRPVYGASEKFQTDPYWRDLILFYEYFNGDDGAGIGASHQTGWSGLAATCIRMALGGAGAYRARPD